MPRAGPSQPPGSRLFATPRRPRAALPAKDGGSGWPQPLWPQTLDPHLHSLLEGQDEAALQPEGRAARGSRAQAAVEAAHKPPANLKKLKTDANIAAAAAAAYATAASSAARAAQAAAQAVQNAPATHLAASAAAAATAGPLGVFAGFPGAGASQGTSYDLGEDAELQQEQRAALFGPLQSPRVPSNLAVSKALKAARQASTPEEKKSAVRLSMSHLALMPMQHECLRDDFTQLASQLQQRVSYLGRWA